MKPRLEAKRSYTFCNWKVITLALKQSKFPTHKVYFSILEAGLSETVSFAIKVICWQIKVCLQSYLPAEAQDSGQRSFGKISTTVKWVYLTYISTNHYRIPTFGSCHLNVSLSTVFSAVVWTVAKSKSKVSPICYQTKLFFSCTIQTP